MSCLRLLVPLVAYASSSLVLAHTGHAHDPGIAGGFAHPFAGLDHLLTAVAVGLWAITQPAGRRWHAPAVFLAAMCGGIALGRASGLPPALEFGIAGSVLAIGLMLLVARRIPDIAAMALFALFGVLHGMAHGAEAPPESTAGAFALFGVGLLAGSAMLHGLGLVCGAAVRTYAQRLWPAVGAACTVAGIWLLAA